PPVLHVLLIILVAMLAGGAWAAIAGYLKVKRGVNEVISNIMLNFIAAAVIAFLLSPNLLGSLPEGSQNLQTKPIPASGQMPTIKAFEGEIYSFLFIAIVVGVGYWIMLNKTVFGFNLRAGRNHPVGIFFAAFLWSFLERSAPVLEFEGVPPEIVIVMQGTIVLSIVIAYEVVARINLRQQQRAVGSANSENQNLTADEVKETK
ncbi:MAG: ABC transporter permease, partial [Actinobacteria bacterium]|nr:ABC transporter permease [Actinomycetota bacterium]